MSPDTHHGERDEDRRKSMLNLKDSLTLINEEKDDDQSSTDNKQITNDRNVNTPTNRQQFDGTSVASVISPSYTDLEGSAFRKTE